MKIERPFSWTYQNGIGYWVTFNDQEYIDADGVREANKISEALNQAYLMGQMSVFELPSKKDAEPQEQQLNG